jgi:hypothetical protein
MFHITIALLYNINTLVTPNIFMFHIMITLLYNVNNLLLKIILLPSICLLHYLVVATPQLGP